MGAGSEGTRTACEGMLSRRNKLLDTNQSLLVRPPRIVTQMSWLLMPSPSKLLRHFARICLLLKVQPVITRLPLKQLKQNSKLQRVVGNSRKRR